MLLNLTKEIVNTMDMHYHLVYYGMKVFEQVVVWYVINLILIQYTSTFKHFYKLKQRLIVSSIANIVFRIFLGIAAMLILFNDINFNNICLNSSTSNSNSSVDERHQYRFVIFKYFTEFWLFHHIIDLMIVYNSKEYWVVWIHHFCMIINGLVYLYIVIHKIESDYPCFVGYVTVTSFIASFGGFGFLLPMIFQNFYEYDSQFCTILTTICFYNNLLFIVCLGITAFFYSYLTNTLLSPTNSSLFYKLWVGLSGVIVIAIECYLVLSLYRMKNHKHKN